MTEPVIVADYACQTGECPTWHPAERRLYWADIPRGRMYSHDPATGRSEQVYQGDAVGGIAVQADGSLLLFQSRGAVRAWHHGRLEIVVDEIGSEHRSRFNDVAADPVGRVYAGTMPSPDHPGSLYLLDTRGSVREVVGGVGEANGSGFSPDLRTFYFTDTRARRIYAYDYARATGDLTARRTFAEVPEGDGVPDGLAIDEEGFVWSARWGAGSIVRLDPAGREAQRIHLPAPKISSMAFGGPDMADLYVTSGGGDRRDDDGPLAGALFRVQPGVRGGPVYLSRVCE